MKKDKSSIIALLDPTADIIQRIAKDEALQRINQHRAERHPPSPQLKRLSQLWWHKFGAEEIARVTAEVKEAQRISSHDTHSELL